MKKKHTQILEHARVQQPRPFTPGVTQLMVREQARRLYRDKLKHRPLNLEDWVMAEKDLVATLEAENTPLT